MRGMAQTRLAGGCEQQPEQALGDAEVYHSGLVGKKLHGVSREDRELALHVRAGRESRQHLRERSAVPQQLLQISHRLRVWLG